MRPRGKETSLTTTVGTTCTVLVLHTPQDPLTHLVRSGIRAIIGPMYRCENESSERLREWSEVTQPVNSRGGRKPEPLSHLPCYGQGGGSPALPGRAARHPATSTESKACVCFSPLSERVSGAPIRKPGLGSPCPCSQQHLLLLL